MSTQTDQFTRESIPQIEQDSRVQVTTNEDVFQARVDEVTDLGDSSCVKLDVVGYDENQMMYAGSAYVEVILGNESYFVKSIEVLN